MAAFIVGLPSWRCPDRGTAPPNVPRPPRSGQPEPRVLIRSCRFQEPSGGAPMAVMPLLALALFLAAGDPAPELVESPLDGVTWIVEEIDDRVATNARPVTLTVANGVISGRSFCNRYHTKRVIYGEIIRITEVAMTAAGCARHLREQEGRFVTALI